MGTYWCGFRLPNSPLASCVLLGKLHGFFQPMSLPLPNILLVVAIMLIPSMCFFFFFSFSHSAIPLKKSWLINDVCILCCIGWGSGDGKGGIWYQSLSTAFENIGVLFPALVPTFCDLRKVAQIYLWKSGDRYQWFFKLFHLSISNFRWVNVNSQCSAGGTQT